MFLLFAMLFGAIEAGDQFWSVFFGTLPATIAAISTAVIAIIGELRRQRAEVKNDKAISAAVQTAVESRDTGVANLTLTAGIAANNNFVPTSAKCIPRVADELPGDNTKALDIAQTALSAAHAAVQETKKENGDRAVSLAQTALAAAHSAAMQKE